uniref:Uncharacterized protein n=1 Tax=Caenorhabditis japonica TaxID=281687 RepID=A0A8R1EQX6_CAEJA
IVARIVDAIDYFGNAEQVKKDMLLTNVEMYEEMTELIEKYKKLNENQ